MHYARWVEPISEPIFLEPISEVGTTSSVIWYNTWTFQVLEVFFC